ncbi:hypothetical protein HY375_00605 [Candidatus Berkelbacteria bacterium]|nr:hypothetical protein [Candidatus Berkelbacteria bacterium]
MDGEFSVILHDMLNTPHMLTGVAIGVATGNPAAAFAGGLVSHYLLDAIPHTDPGTWHFNEAFPHRVSERDLTLGFADLAVAVALLIWLAGQAPIVTAASLAGLVGAVLPDVLVVASLFFPKLVTVRGLDRYFAVVARYHRTSPPKVWAAGFLTQGIIVGIAVWYLLAS